MSGWHCNHCGSPAVVREEGGQTVLVCSRGERCEGERDEEGPRMERRGGQLRVFDAGGIA